MEENTPASGYDANNVVRHFDDFGIQEWERLVQSPSHEVSFYIHAYYLEKHIIRGKRVLEIGAGPGRFTQVLSRLGAQIVVADISSVQLELNKRLAMELGFDNEVIDRQQVDMCDLTRFDSNSFDDVVAYGGPFSYVLDKRDLALTECLRVLAPGGKLLLSVMSLWGSVHGFLDGVFATPESVNQMIIRTGDILPLTFPERKGNFMHLFHAGELKDWLSGYPLEILDISASGCLSLTWGEVLKGIRNDAEKWNELLKMELLACAEEGCLNMGTHLIAVTAKRKLS